ncbi:CU044_5270 family protein [Actinoallomurus iriomotensis]|uniref:CU044_5270 family protein n=1 Tax=Actinoallomurus iriomotensis TaxID=478107 RepID=A0A9W6RVJ2_9ACTN|nr:CU044_5270 family protein [Actinoallomurus iriomotensis]GLY83411.1 hypothetical protein Airi02_013410 [Actinoallomurus iriomotensis]
MKTDADIVRSLLAGHDPARAVQADVPERERALEAILTEPPAVDSVTRKRWRPRWRTVAVVATAAAATAIVGLTALPQLRTTHVSRVTTPPLLELKQPVYGAAATKALRDLAARAERQPDTIGHGRVVYSKIQGWYLDSTVSRRRTSAVVVPRTEEQWVAPDGSGRQLASAGRPWFPTTKSRQEWERQGRPPLGARNSDDRFGPGGLSSDPDVDKLPTDPAALRRELEKSGADLKGAAVLLEAEGDLWRQPLRPALQGALLRVLADSGEMGYAGPVRDRAGRAGVAFTLDQNQTGLPERDVIIFDRRTGRALSEETILTKDPGKLPVRIPSVTSYALFLGSGRVDGMNERP